MRSQALALLAVAQRSALAELPFGAPCLRHLTALAPHSSIAAARVAHAETRRTSTAGASASASASSELPRSWGTMRSAWGLRAFSATVNDQPTHAHDGLMIQVGDVVSGVVRSVQESFGVHVDLGSGSFPGLLHVSKVSQERVGQLETLFKQGDQVKALVRRVDKGRKRIELSTQELEATPGDMLRNPQLVFDAAEETAERLREGSATMPKAGDLVAGAVLSTTKFGAFVDLGGRVGLLHKSRVSAEAVADARAALRVGDRIKVLVIGVDQGRYDLSTKELEPAPGDMLRNPGLVYDKAEEMAARLQQRAA